MKTLLVLALSALVRYSYAAPVSDLALLQREDPNRLEQAIIRYTFPFVIDELQKLQGQNPAPLKPSDVVKAKPKDDIEALLQGEESNIHLVAKYRPIYLARKLQAGNPAPLKPDNVELTPSNRLAGIAARLQRLFRGGNDDYLAQLEICEHC